jgi:hypothetical protein
MLRSQANTLVDIGLGPLLPDCFHVRIGVKHRSLLSAAKERYKAERPDKQKYSWEQR